jgi:3-deoxy-D-manno-octulosonic-acid transferase
MARGDPGSGAGVPPIVARLARVLYGLAWLLATPLVIAYLLARARRQPAYRAHWAERWALRWSPAPAGWLTTRGGLAGASAAGASARPIWIHAVSVGETRAAQPLIHALLDADPSLRILLTHMTPTGRATGCELFATRWPDRVHQVYLPYDLGWAAGRFLARWRPRLGILMETELWPALCAQAARRGVPLVIANARLSERSLARGLRWRALTMPALAGLQAVLAQTPADARRLRMLGREDVAVLGNLKFDTVPSADAVALGRAWRAVLDAGGAVGAGGAGGAVGDNRPVLLCASTRDGEEVLLLRAWVAAMGDAPAPRPRLLIVPRHPQRFDEVAEAVAAQGLTAMRRSQAGWPEVASRADVLLGDSMGEMAAYVAMADAAIIGGSLLPFGGQNLIEPCALGVPVVVGPHTENFAQAADEAIEAGAACRTADATDAIDTALALLADPAKRAAMGEAGTRFAHAHRGATQRTLQALAIWLRAQPDGETRR